jgi:hypothetical protein
MSGGSYPGSSVVLTLAMLAAAAGFWRVFAGVRWILPLTVVVVGVHLLSWVIRRLKMSGWLVAPVLALAVVLLSTWTVVPSSTVHGLPWLSTWESVRRATDIARDNWSAARLPVVPSSSSLLFAAGICGVAAALADWASFRVQSSLQGLAPVVAVFALCQLLGGSRHRIILTAAMAVTATIFLVVHGAATRRKGDEWVDGVGSPRFAVTVRSGAPFVLLATIAAIGIGAQLPASAPINSHFQTVIGPRAPSSSSTQSAQSPARGPMPSPQARSHVPAKAVTSPAKNQGSHQTHRAEPVWLLLVLAGALVLAGWITVNLTLRQLRWRRRRHASVAPAYCARVAWAELTESLLWWHQCREPGETRNEFVRRASQSLSAGFRSQGNQRTRTDYTEILATDPALVAAVVDRIDFSDDPISSSLADTASVSSERTVRLLRAHETLGMKLEMLVHPRQSWG